MSSDDNSAPSEITVASDETPEAATDVLAPAPAGPPAVAEPETLVDGLRYLRQRIPGFTYLTVREKRSHTRAANLDPEFLAAGLHAAGLWHGTEALVQRTGEELRQEQEEIEHWDQVLIELRALTDGIAAANLKRKHHLGEAILTISKILGVWMASSDRNSPHAYMRPYYENMKRAYLKTQNFRKKKKGEE